MSAAAATRPVKIDPHTCDSRVPVCPCGRRWEYRTDGPNEPARYTSEAAVELYRVLYGRHPTAREVSP